MIERPHQVEAKYGIGELIEAFSSHHTFYRCCSKRRIKGVDISQKLSVGPAFTCSRSPLFAIDCFSVAPSHGV
jgi:hypothetical protein